MKQSNFTEVQIVKILSEQNFGKTVNEICRDHGISQPTFYNWKSKYGGLDVQHLTKMKEMEKELSAAYSLDLRGEMLSKLVRKIYEETGQAAFWGDLL